MIQFKNGSMIKTLKTKEKPIRSIGYFIDMDTSKDRDYSYIRWHGLDGNWYAGVIVGYKDDYPVVWCSDGEYRLCII